MQEDQHFYGTYCLARAAGINPTKALTIATAAQFVDEALTDEPVLSDSAGVYVPVPSSHAMMAWENMDIADQWRVWVPYHFLPGNQGGGIKERLICRPGGPENQAAQAIIAFALENLEKPYGAHLLGIVTHVLQDTYSHAGFSGIASRYNKINETSVDIRTPGVRDLLDMDHATMATVGKLLRAPGHASVGCCSDYPFLDWAFLYEYGEDVCPRAMGDFAFSRKNTEVFFAACQHVYALFRQALGQAPKWRCTRPGCDEKVMLDAVRSLLDNVAAKEERCSDWQEAMKRGRFCDPEERDNHVAYDGVAWQPDTEEGAGLQSGSDTVLFMQASYAYRQHVLCEVLPRLHPA